MNTEKTAVKTNTKTVKQVGLKTRSRVRAGDDSYGFTSCSKK